jgi:hypothetical protein
MRTFPVRRVLLDFAALLGDVLPPAGAACLVQCLQVALGLFALRGGLLRSASAACNDVAATLDVRAAPSLGVHTTMVLTITLARCLEA